MMKQKLLVLLALLLSVATLTEGSNKKDRKVCKHNHCGLKDVVKEHYPKNLYFGMATQQRLIGKLSVKITDREFDYVTPANDFKQSYIHPEPEKWQWTRPDAFLAHAKECGQVLRVHGPISPQCSHWVRADNRTHEELSKMLDEFLTALCMRINENPTVKWMDVVNETICKKRILYAKGKFYEAGDWFGPREGNDKWENPWTVLGFETYKGEKYPIYIKRAFEIANKYAPNVKLIINQDSQMDSLEWEKMKKLVEYLRAQGLRVDGIGWQAHIDAGLEKKIKKMEYLNQLVTWCHKNNLEFHITEMNVWINEGDTEETQAATFKGVLDVVLPHVAKGPVGICFWNVRDEDTDKAKRRGTIWRNDGSARPAYDAIKQSLLQNAIK